MARDCPVSWGLREPGFENGIANVSEAGGSGLDNSDMIRA